MLREGAEVVLFLYGIAASEPQGWPALLMGGILGVAGGGLVSWLLYRGLLAIPAARLFEVTGVLIAVMAAGMAGQAAVYLVQADLLPAWGQAMWDTSTVLPEPSLVGRALKALVGYSGSAHGHSGRRLRVRAGGAPAGRPVDQATRRPAGGPTRPRRRGNPSGGHE